MFSFRPNSSEQTQRTNESQSAKTLSHHLRLAVEQLERRECPSVFYDFDIMARTGQNGVGTSIQQAVSINDSGAVAFVAASGSFQDVFVATGPLAVTGIASAASNRTYGNEVQINNSNQVAAVAITSGSTVSRNARIYTLASPGSFTNVGLGSTPLANLSHFDSLGAFVSMTNDGQLAFAGLEADEPVAPSLASSWEIHLADGSPVVDSRDLLNTALSEVAQLSAAPTFFRFAAADGDRVVIGSRDGAGGTPGVPKRIVWYDNTGGVTTQGTIATTAGGVWSDLGVRPGISDDGRIVTFYGNEASDVDGDGITGPGLFASVELTIGRRLVRLASLADGFSAFAIDQRVGVTNRNDEQLAASVVFQATDATGKLGVFRSQLKFHVDSITGTIITGFTASKPSSIVLQGDTIPGLGVVDSVAIHDPVSNDGRAAFWVNSSGGQAVVRTWLPAQRVVLAWGESVPVLVKEVITPSGPTYPVVVGTMPAFAATSTYQEQVRARVQQQFKDSGINGIEVTNGSPEPGATVVYFTNPLGILLGQAYSGIDRFNRQSSDSVVVMVQGSLETDAETVTHEVGHSLGLRHIDPPGALEVMDYDAVVGDIEVFTDMSFNITEPPQVGGNVSSNKHNPVYHLKRFVEGASDAELTAAGTQSGDWDRTSVFFGLLPFTFSFRLRNGLPPAAVTLHQVYILAGESVPDGFRTLAYYESITLESLSQQSFTLTEGQGLRLFAASTPGGPHDLSLAAGDPSLETNVVVFPTVGTNNYFLQISDSSSAGFSTLADVTVAISVPGGNAPPVLDPIGNRGIDELVTLTFTATASDADVPANVLTFSLIGAPAGATIDPDTGLFAWTPTEAQGPGMYVFKVRVTDDGSPALFDEEQITVVVAEINQSPVAINDTASTFRPSPVSIDVLGNDTDPDGTLDPTTVAVGTGPASGAVSVDPATGAITYTPNAGFIGTDAFTYTVRDNASAISNAATVNVTVVPNARPVANADSAMTVQNVPISVVVLANDTDTDGTVVPSTLRLVTLPANGSVSVNPGTGTVTYTPNPGFTGTDTFSYRVSDDGGESSNPATVSVSVGRDETAPPPLPIATSKAVPSSVVGSGAGQIAAVKVFNADGSVRFTVTPYPGFTGGITTATGDLTGDGVADIVTGAGAGGGPHVKAFDGVTGAEIRSFFAFDAAFSGGVRVASGDFTGDGRADIVVAAGVGGGPHVRIFDGLTGAEVASFYAYDPGFTGGVNVAVDESNGTLVAGTLNGPAHVRVLRHTPGKVVELQSFYAFDPKLLTGANVAALLGNIYIAPAANSDSTVRVYESGDVRNFRSFDPYPGFTGGVRVTANRLGQIVTGAGAGGGPHVKVFDALTLAEVSSFFAFDQAFNGGVFIG